MAGYGDYPFGLREVKVVSIDGLTAVSLPAAQKLMFKETMISDTLRGNDRKKSIVTIADGAEWSLEQGGISLEAYAVMTGRTLVAAGTTPNQTNTLTVSAGDEFPYFKIYGKVVGDDAQADVHVKIYKAKLSAAPEGTFEDGKFYIQSCSGMAIDDDTNGIADIVQNETAAALPST